MNEKIFNELEQKQDAVLCALHTTANFIRMAFHKQAVMELDISRRLLVDLINELHEDQAPGKEPKETK